MLFSIIMPAYNAEKFIEFSIKSVLAQTVSSWELVIVDDGSYDNTINICKNYSEKDNRIKIVECRNSGVSNARNIGVSYASGEYIVFLDSDDSLIENCIEIYLRLIKELCQDLIISNYYTQTTCIKKARKIDAQVISSKEKIEELFEMALRQSQYHGDKWFGNLHSVWGKCFKKSIIKAHSLKFNTNFFNLILYNNILYFNLYKTKNLKNNLMPLFINPIAFNSFYMSTKEKCYYLNYLYNFYTSLYTLNFPYSLTLNLKGICYKFVVENQVLKLRVGYSHFLTYNVQPEIFLKLVNPTTLTLYSNNKLILTQFASFLKLQKKTNLYKGTGIFYINECITLKKKNNNKNKNAK